MTWGAFPERDEPCTETEDLDGPREIVHSLALHHGIKDVLKGGVGPAAGEPHCVRGRQSPDLHVEIAVLSRR